MSERTCDQCGAQSRAEAAYCWRCHASFGGGAPGVAGTIRAGSIRPRPAGIGGHAGNGSAVLVADPPSGVERPSDGSWVGLLKAVLLIGAFAGGWWLVDHFFFGEFPFPDQVAGYERVESETARDASQAIAAFSQALDVEMEMAFYGTETQPVYMMFVFEMPEQLPLMGAQPGSPGSIPFGCQEQAQGSSCFWSGQDGKVLGLGGFGVPAAQVEPVARQIQAEFP